MSLIPGMWYMFITVSYILTVPIGFNMPYNSAMGVGAVCTVIYAVMVWKHGLKLRETKASIEAVPVMA